MVSTGEQGTTSAWGRVERPVAVMRAAVVGVTAVVYVASIGVRRPVSAYAVGILAVAAVYSLWVLLARPFERAASLPFGAATLAVDGGLVTLWCHATGATRSEFWALYVLLIVEAAMRYGFGEVLGVSLAQSALYVAVMLGSGEAKLSSLLFRPAVLVLAGLSVGALAGHRRAAEQREREAEEAAEAAADQLDHERIEAARLRLMDEAKTEFVAIAAHELRAPLAAIRGVVETLRRVGDDIEPEVERELLDGAAEQAARLTRLLDDLLTVSRIEAGTVVLEFSDVPIDELVADAARASGTESVVSVSIVEAHTVHCDADRLVRVLSNLLDNARKHSPEGAVIGVDVRREGDAVRFTIRDHGAGVPEDEREVIFERYRRVDEGRVRGTGLGLFIARSIVEAHGGTIGVRDAAGGGAEFYFAIPSAGSVNGKAQPQAEHARA